MTRIDFACPTCGLHHRRSDHEVGSQKITERLGEIFNNLKSPQEDHPEPDGTTPMTARFAIASPQMKTLFAAMLATFLLPGCSKDVAEVHESESEIRDQLAGFLDAALDEFTNRYGSHTEPWGVGNERWETPFVEAGLLVMAAREFARIEAFSQGLEYERPDPPILKPPTPRSFWLPISPEGTYSFEIISVSASGDKALASVNFTMALDGTAYPDTHVTYSLLRSGDRWRISNVTSADGYNLRKYLLRSHVMDDGG